MLFRIFHCCYLDNYNITVFFLTHNCYNNYSCLPKSLCIEIVSLVDCIVRVVSTCCAECTIRLATS